jgi:hypothetical protein
MRLPRRRLVIPLVTSLVIAAGLVIAWRVHSSSQTSGSAASAGSAGKQFLIPGINTKSQTPYRLATGLYVNDPAAWKQLSSAAQSGLLAKLHQAERSFRAAGKQVFPSPQLLTVENVPPGANSTASAFRLGPGDATLTSWPQGQPAQVTADFGATALGSQPFSLGTAAYRGYTGSGLFGWAPCASTKPGGAAHVVTICGGQALAEASGAQEAGMTGAMVTVTGTAAAQADLPIIASYTNRTAYTEKVTVTGAVASVTMTMFASLLGAACERSALKYTTPGSGSLAPPLPDPPVISLDGCLGTFHEQVPLPGALQLSAAMSAAQGVTTAIGDDLLAVTDKTQVSSSPALQACTIGRTLSDLAAVIKDFGGLGVPSCQPEALPRWTGTVAAGATVQFSIAPATQAINLGTGGEVAGLFTFANLHVTSQCSGSGACRALTPVPNPAVIAHDEAIINQAHFNCTAFEPAGKGCPFSVATTPDGQDGLVYAITLLDNAGDSCAGSIVYFFDSEKLITDTTALPPYTTPGAEAVTSPRVGQFRVVWSVNPSVNAICAQYGTAGTDTYLYGWNGTTMNLLAGTPPTPPRAFPPAAPSPATACPDSSQLLSAWNAAPETVRQSWTPVTITGFNYISCWRTWVVADPVSPSPGNGEFVFSQSPTLHLITVTELQQVFQPEVCAAADAPPGWTSPPLISCSG